MGYVSSFSRYIPMFSGVRTNVASAWNSSAFFKSYIPFSTPFNFSIFRPNSFLSRPFSYNMTSSYMPAFNWQRPLFLSGRNYSFTGGFGSRSSYSSSSFGSLVSRSSSRKISSVKSASFSSVSKAGWTNALNLSKERLTQMGFNTPEKQWAFSKLKPEMQHAVLKLTEYAESQGIKISYGSKRSIFRTRADQEAIYRTSRKGYAAKPGNSRHETGEAVDIHIAGANSHDKNDPKFRKLGEYWQSMGYKWGAEFSACEPWHFDLRPTTKKV